MSKSFQHESHVPAPFLKGNERMIQLLFKNSNIYLVKTDMEGNYTFVNEYFCKRMGVKQEDAIGLSGLKHIIPEDHLRCIEIISACVQNPNTPQSINLRKPLAKGGYIHTDWEFTYLPEENDQPGEIVCFGYDTSEVIKTRERQELLIGQVSDTILTLDKKGIIQFVSDSWASNFEFDLANSLDKPFSQFAFLQNQDLPIDEHIIQTCIDSKESLKHRLIHSNGNEFWVETKVSIDRYSGEYLLVMRDITKGREAANQIKKQNLELQSLIESTNAIHWKMDLKRSVFTYIDQKVEKILGYSKESWTNMNVWAERIHPDDRKYAQTFCEASTNEGKDHEFEYRAVAKDGSQIWLKDVVTVIKKNGVPTELVGFLVDISQQKEAQGTVSLQADLLNAVGQSVIATRPKGEIIFWNKMAERLYKYSSQEVIGKKIQDIIPTSQSPEEIESMFKMLLRGETFSGEVLLKDRFENYFPTQIINSPFFDEAGRLQAIIGISQDLTEQKRIEAMQIAAHDLETRNKEMKRFAFLASHDLQQPLRTIKSFSELLERDYGAQLDENGREYIRFLSDASERLMIMVKELLRYSLIGRNDKPTEINCEKLIQEVLGDLHLMIQESEAKIQIGPLPQIIGYQTDVRMLFQNLISNAIKFRAPEKSPNIKITAQPKNDSYQFCIEDDGIGIEDQAKQKIFDIFQRGHHRSKYEGTGIGLAHCQKITELHQGEIWVESTLGKGSKFYFTLKSPIAND